MTKSEDRSDAGAIGLGVIGKNFVFNMLDNGISVAVYDCMKAKIDELVDSDQAKGKPVTPCQSLAELVNSLSSPRKVLLMIKSTDPVEADVVKLYPDLSAVDAVVAELCELLSPGDIIIDGGNTHFRDTARRAKYAESLGLLYVGAGISGGSEGARYGASIMPGGSEKAWPLVAPILQRIAAKVGPDGKESCCDWIGPGGSAHYVKMLHNGIEYASIQLICEAYWVLKHALGLSNAELHEVFSQWNQTELNGCLIEITGDVFSVIDPETGSSLIDLIVDKAGAKGTGKWTSQDALELEVPSTMVTAAVHARFLSGMKQSRCRASKLLAGTSARRRGNRDKLIEEVRQALLASMICSYAQGFAQLRAAAVAYDWKIDFSSVAAMWRGGCIIRATLLNPIMDAFEKEPDLEDLLLAPHFRRAIKRSQLAWRRVVMLAAELGLPAPVFSAALAHYDGYRSEQLPANLLQALRDYFGGHTYQRVDKLGLLAIHTEWRRLVLQFRRLCHRFCLRWSLTW